MRIVILATLALLPLVAHSQTAASSSQALQANLTPPARLVRTSTATPATTNVSVAHAAPMMHELIKTNLMSPEVQHADATLTYTLLGDTNSQTFAPQLVHTVGRVLPTPDQNHLDADVAVTLTVDFAGNPENIHITKSAGPALDASTLAAVRQYHFKPAIVGNQPVQSDMAIEVKLSK